MASMDIHLPMTPSIKHGLHGIFHDFPIKKHIKYMDCMKIPIDILAQY